MNIYLLYELKHIVFKLHELKVCAYLPLVVTIISVPNLSNCLQCPSPSSSMQWKSASSEDFPALNTQIVTIYLSMCLSKERSTNKLTGIQILPFDDLYLDFDSVDLPTKWFLSTQHHSWRFCRLRRHCFHKVAFYAFFDFCCCRLQRRIFSGFLWICKVELVFW